jgi:hypothetical protein
VTFVTSSQTSLPPIVRVSDSSDAAYRIPAGTDPQPHVVRINVIDVQELRQKAQPIGVTKMATVRVGQRAKASTKKR